MYGGIRLVAMATTTTDNKRQVELLQPDAGEKRPKTCFENQRHVQKNALRNGTAEMAEWV